jgi:hypothetical protein
LVNGLVILPYENLGEVQTPEQIPDQKNGQNDDPAQSDNDNEQNKNIIKLEGISKSSKINQKKKEGSNTNNSKENTCQC